ncbi:MAG: hypothetical protein LBH68_04445, partial [Bifidobacteriaceae bacterium]|nr:hypothetical protein [Bifidobacteriaceae bacterium]
RRSEEEELLVRQDSMTAQVTVTGGQTGPIDQAALDQMIAPLEALPGCTRGIWEHPRKPTSGSGTGLRRGDKDPWPLILETNSLEVFSVPDQTPAE